MKIISKYKDFYDFIVQDHDADITYVRQIGLVKDYLDDMIKKNNNMSMPYYSSYYGYQDYYSKRYANSVHIANYIFGIYPFVYAQPTLKIVIDSPSGGDTLTEVMPKSLIEKMLNYSSADAKTELEIIDEIKLLILRAVSEKPYVDVSKIKFNVEDLAKVLPKYTWKIECPDLFYKLEAPVFTKYYSELYDCSAYYEHWPKVAKGTGDHIHYVTNICFKKLYKNIL